MREPKGFGRRRSEEGEKASNESPREGRKLFRLIAPDLGRIASLAERFPLGLI
jgi:hypothetical protein